MAFENICPPALIYIFFSLTQIIIDTTNGLYNTAFMKLWVSSIFTILLNYLCASGLGIISWFIVFIPFILMTVIITMLLLVFGLDPASGKAILKYNNNVQQPKPIDYRLDSAKKSKISLSNTYNTTSSSTTNDKKNVPHDIDMDIKDMESQAKSLLNKTF